MTASNEAIAEWVTDWEQKKDPGFHEKSRNHLLVKNLDVMLAGRSNIKLFFPLCGKCVDMKWMYDLGHTVVGVEAVEIGIKSFFSEQGLDPVEEDCPAVKGKLFKTKDGRIRIYCCNIFDFNSDVEGEFDGIFDRGAFAIFDKETRPKYADLLVSLMSNGCRYLLNTFQFEKGCSWGDSHNYTEQEIIDIFTSRRCFIERVDLVAIESDIVFDRLQLITKKC